MQRHLKLAINRFDRTPASLRDEYGNGELVAEVTVNLASLYHHYYLDFYGHAPPDPDPTQFEYLRFLLPTADFRLKGDGIGDCTIIRRHSSAALGQAFCRWFLHDHLNMTYFAHIQHVLNRPSHVAFPKVQVKRIQKGDVPDYLCAQAIGQEVFLAEAKGRYPSISFKSKEFTSWRNQFARVLVTDKQNRPRSLKGFIVGTRFATENAPNSHSGIYAEDPETHGEGPLDEGSRLSLGTAVASSHYANLATKLNQPLLAAALETGFGLSEQLRLNAIVWEYQGPNLRKRRFVGGYYPSRSGALAIEIDDEGRPHRRTSDPFRLDIGSGTFFGLEESIFRQVVQLARRRSATPISLELGRYEEVQHFYSAVSILRDGSIFAPLDFFAPAEQIQL